MGVKKAFILALVLIIYSSIALGADSYIIVHAVNPEGVEIAGIEGMGGILSLIDNKSTSQTEKLSINSAFASQNNAAVVKSTQDDYSSIIMCDYTPPSPSCSGRWWGGRWWPGSGMIVVERYYLPSHMCQYCLDICHWSLNFPSVGSQFYKIELDKHPPDTHEQIISRLYGYFNTSPLIGKTILEATITLNYKLQSPKYPAINIGFYKADWGASWTWMDNYTGCCAKNQWNCKQTLLFSQDVSSTNWTNGADLGQCEVGCDLSYKIDPSLIHPGQDFQFVIRSNNEQVDSRAYVLVPDLTVKVAGEYQPPEENQPPLASFTYSPENPMAGEIITFDASSSYDPDGQIVKYEWNFWDGNTTEGMKVTHVYNKDGDYVVILTINDNNGSICHESKVITVTPIPVLLVHGIYSSSGMWNTSMFGDEFVVETIDLNPNNGDIIDLAAQLKTKIEDMKNKYKCKKVDIVAHSMGGLVSRWYIQNFRGSDVRKLVMIETPNHGSEFGALKWLREVWGGVGYVMGEAASQMLPHSQFLRNLNLNDGCDTRKEWIDYTSTTTQYYTLAADRFPTISHKHTNNSGREFKDVFVTPGDSVVPYNSVRLDNVDMDSISPCHICGQGRSASVIDKVKNFLRGGSELRGLESSLYNQISNSGEQPSSKGLASSESINDIIHPNESKIYNISIDSTITGAYFLTIWNDGNLNLALYLPNGTIINSSSFNFSQNIDYEEGELYKYYYIKQPANGTWSIRIYGENVSAEGTNFSFSAFLESDLFVGINTNKEIFDPNEKINISAYVGTNESAVTGAFVVAQISKPDNTTQNITLYDDGLHDDILANDGIYSNSFINTTITGTYHILVLAKGTIEGQQFERETFTTIWVEQYPDLAVYSPDISFSNNNPYERYIIKINATIRNTNNKDVQNITIFFFDGKPSDDNNLLIGEVNISSIPAKNNSTSSILWNTTYGKHDIYVMISPFNSFLEKNYTNNKAYKEIDVKTRWSRNLTEGWNLISIPFNISNKTAEWLCNQVNCSSIFAFYNQTWRYYTPTNPDSENTLKTIDETMGLWIKVNNSLELSLEGSSFEKAEINLIQGWNLIGYPLLYTSSINETLKEINFSSIYSYKDNKWYSYVKKRNDFLNSLESFTLGYGYWVYSNNATNLILTNK